MFALLIAVGALFLAVIAAAVIDPRPSGAADADDGSQTLDGLTLSM